MSSLKWTSSNLACVCVCVCAYVYVWIFDSIGIVKILERSTLKELSTKQIKARNMNKGIFNTYVTHSCITFHTKSAAAATITIGNSSISTTSEDLEKDKSNTVNPKGNQSWISIGRTDAEAEAPILWPSDGKSQRPWCWESLRAKGEGIDRGWDARRASLTQWTWVWANSGRWWRTGKPGMLQSMRLQRVRYDWSTEQQCHLQQHEWTWGLY